MDLIKHILKIKVSFLGRIILLLIICYSLNSQSFGQLRQTAQNKLGILIQVVPQKINIATNGVSGENTTKNYIAPGVELFYERIFDDYFILGAALNVWAPPELDVSVKNSYAPYIGAFTPRQPETYKLTISETGFGIYTKALLSRNASRGIKPFLQSGITFINATIDLKAMIQNPQATGNPPDELIEHTENISSPIIVKYFGGGFLYNFRSGFSLQASARYLAGIAINEFQDELEKKYISLYIHQTALFELGCNFSF